MLPGKLNVDGGMVVTRSQLVPGRTLGVADAWPLLNAAAGRAQSVFGQIGRAQLLV
jgi:hypothetical protein